MIVYIVKVGDNVSSLAYKTLEEAQEFVKSRVDEKLLEGQQPYYHVYCNRTFQYYTIMDVRVA